MSYGINNETNTDQAFKSFVNLETITKGKNNLDELSAAFYDEYIVTKEIDSLLFDWLNWYDLNKCYTLSMALNRFEEVAELNPLPDYKDSMVINKLMDKNSLLAEDGSYLQSAYQLIEKDSLGRITMLPSWDCTRWP